MIYHNKQSGFSLVETLVAVSLLLIIIVGPMTISTKTAKSSSFASEQVQAFFLAQEGLELAQKARDDFRLHHYKEKMIGNDYDSWKNFMENADYSSCFNSTGCGLFWGNSINGIMPLPKNCAVSQSGTNVCTIYKNNRDNSRSLFTHDSSSGTEKTVFTRRVTFGNIAGDPNQVAVKSEVTWRTGSLLANQSVTVHTFLFNTDYDPSN